MTGKRAFKIVIARRIFQLRKTFKTDTQQIRLKTMKNLEELFDLSNACARGQVTWQCQNGMSEKLSIKQRQIWARVSAYIAQVINTVALAFDEKQIDRDLQELERLVNEAKAKAKNEESCEADSGTEGTLSSRGSS